MDLGVRVLVFMSLDFPLWGKVLLSRKEMAGIGGRFWFSLLSL